MVSKITPIAISQTAGVFTFPGVRIAPSNDVIPLDIQTVEGATQDIIRIRSTAGAVGLMNMDYAGYVAIGTTINQRWKLRVANNITDPASAPAAIRPEMTVTHLAAAGSQTIRVVDSNLFLAGTQNYNGHASGMGGFAFLSAGITAFIMSGLNFGVGVLNASGTISNARNINVSFFNTAAGTMTNATNLYIGSPTLSGGTIVNEYGIYIENISAGSTLAYAIYTNAGDVRFGDSVLATSLMGLGNQASVLSTTLLYGIHTFNTSSTIYGGYFSPYNQGTGNIYGLVGRPVVLGATGGTNSIIAGVTSTMVLDATSTNNVTNAYGIYYTGASVSGSGSITNLVGLRITDVTEGTNTNYAIQTGQGIVYFGDNVAINSTGAYPLHLNITQSHTSGADYSQYIATSFDGTLTGTAYGIGFASVLSYSADENGQNGLGIGGILQATATGASTYSSLVGAQVNAYTNSTATSGQDNLFAIDTTASVLSGAGNVTNMYGQRNKANMAASASGTVSNTRGIWNYVYNNSTSGGVMTTAYGTYNEVFANTGDITNAYGAYFYVHETSGSITTAFGVRIAVTPAGTINYGIYIDAVDAATDNYSIYTNAGLAFFGDDLRTEGYLGFQEQAGAPTAIGDWGQIWTQSNNNLYFQDGDGNIHMIHGYHNFKSYTVTTQGLGSSPTIYAAGFYEAPQADANLTQASTTQTYLSANQSLAAHAFIVAGGAGSVDTGQVGLRVTGISINDQGTRTTSDSEVLTDDITSLVTDQYLETTKKWLGQVTFELYVVSGSPTTYSLDFNYGVAKYDDWGNEDFTITDVECVGYAGANDSDFDIELIFHTDTGWTYSAAAFVPGGNILAQLSTDHSTDDQLIAGEHFAWKRDNLNQAVAGADMEGFLVRITSTANNAVEYLNIHIGVDF